MLNNTQANISAKLTEQSSEATQRAIDRAGREVTREQFPPPEDLVQRMEANRKKLKKRIQAYRKRLAVKCIEEHKQAAASKIVSAIQKEPHRRTELLGENKEAYKSFGRSFVIPTLETLIRTDAFMEADESTRARLNKGISDENPIILEKNLRKLVSCFRRFDWRTYNVVPRVRVQKDAPGEIGTCWAYVATEAFESALMIQRAKFPPANVDIHKIMSEQVTLNVNTALERVGTQGRHEPVFDEYLKRGIPLNEVQINESGERDTKLTSNSSLRTIKAVAWNWVTRPPARVPARDKEIQELKKDLLEHGPLAVMVAFNDEFKRYGSPGQDAGTGENQSSDVAPSKFNLRFTAGAATFKEDEKGRLFLNLLSQEVGAKSLRDFDEREFFLEMRFPADKASIVESQTKSIKPRPTDSDDAVIFDRAKNRLRFTANNGVVIEKDSDTGEVIVQFPANTKAEFDRDSATGDLIVRFPNDKAPVFRSDKFEGADEFKLGNHFVLLIGWDDDKDGGAWIIQNTFRDWGYQCNGPNLLVDSRKSEASEDRGYMYIGYGNNLIGQFAAWIEARLLKRGLWGQ